MASGESSPMTTPPPGPAYTPESIQRMQQVNVNICKHIKTETIQFITISESGQWHVICKFWPNIYVHTLMSKRR